jgi:class 3 adenylate cyclase
MPWQANRAQERIRELMNNVPTVITETFSESYLPRFLEEQRAALQRGLPKMKPLVNLPQSKAVIVDAVHLYATLTNYDEYRLQEGRETERSHARALNFLHLHYGACDRAIERHGAHRVDFHGPRVHIVVAEPAGREFAKERVIRALALAKEIEQLSDLANTEIAEGHYPARFRIGIDSGHCVAINSGRGIEQEPLFLGCPANYAAKLAEGSEPGIYVSDSVRALFAMNRLGVMDLERHYALAGTDIHTMLTRAPEASQKIYAESESDARQLLHEWQTEISAHEAATGGGASRFHFHHHRPPLSTIDYSELSPGNSIRMPLASIFADIDGYTRYIDQSVANGNVGEAVRALHVMRGELNNVLKQDFQGRKVRFIGDCIHGVLAEGSATTTDAKATVGTALRCAGGMRSSFELCQTLLPTTGVLGLAIGIELGPTPISRIGIRGERSVRLASSIATARSAALQRECDGTQTAIGPWAKEAASRDVQQMFGHDYIIGDFDYPQAAMLGMETKSLGEPAFSIGTPAIPRAHAQE